MRRKDFDRVSAFFTRNPGLTDRERCDILSGAATGLAGTIKDDLASRQHALDQSVELSQSGKDTYVAKVGNLIMSPLTALGSGGLMIYFTGNLAFKVLDDPKSSASMAFSALGLAMVGAYIGLRGATTKHHQYRSAIAGIESGPSFFNDPKMDWPLPKGQSILELTEAQAAEGRRQTRREARKAWASLPYARKIEMAFMDGDTFLTWCARETDQERSVILKEWRKRAALDSPIQTAILNERAQLFVERLALKAPALQELPSRLGGAKLRRWQAKHHRNDQAEQSLQAKLGQAKL